MAWSILSKNESGQVKNGHIHNIGKSINLKTQFLIATHKIHTEEEQMTTWLLWVNNFFTLLMYPTVHPVTRGHFLSLELSTAPKVETTNDKMTASSP